MDWKNYSKELNRIIVVVGISGSGKTSVVKLLQSKYNYHRIITYTTRPKRKYEVEGVDYHFLDNKTFDKEKYDIALYAKRGKYAFFTTHNDLEKIRTAGKSIIVLDWSGLEQLRQLPISHGRLIVVRLVCDKYIAYDRVKERDGKVNDKTFNEDVRTINGIRCNIDIITTHATAKEVAKELNRVCTKWIDTGGQLNHYYYRR